MQKTLEEQKGKLYELGGMLESIRSFLIGAVPQESCDKPCVECFRDSLIENTKIINDALETAKKIKDALEGDK